MAKILHLSTQEPPQTVFNFELPEEIKTAMSEIEVAENMLAKGDALMDLILPDNTLVVMIKRIEGSFCVPKGKTKLRIGDKLLVITDNDDELRKTYDSLGITNYSITKNS